MSGNILIVDRQAIYKCALFVIFIFATGNFTESIIPESLSFFNQFVVLFISIGFFIFVYLGFIKVCRVKCLTIPFFIYIIFIIYSISTLLWAETSLNSAFRAGAFFITTLFAFLLASLIRFENYFKLLMKAQIILLVLSLLVIVAVPSVGVDAGDHEGAWKGIFSQKNSFGRSVAMCAILSVALRFSNVKYLSATSTYMLYVFCCFVLFFSDSRTSLFMVLFFPVIILFLKYTSNMQRSEIFGPATLSMLVIVFLYFFMSDEVYLGNVSSANDYLYFFGAEILLTGRATLWAYVHHSIYYYEKEVFGFGYDGFWGHSFSVMDKWGLGAFEANDSHNGFLDVFLQTGWVGLGLLYFSLGSLFLHSTAMLASNNYLLKNYGRLIITFLVFIVLFNLTESTFLKATNIMQFTLSFVFFSTLFYPKSVNEVKS